MKAKSYRAKLPVAAINGDWDGLTVPALRNGDAEPVIVEPTRREGRYAIADGCHRMAGLIAAGETEIDVIILSGEDIGAESDADFARIQVES
jgi:hypothetical protein